MDFRELVRTRYSVRKYTTAPVAEDMLEAVLEAARLAPTAANRQAFHLVVVPTAGREEALGRIFRQKFVVSAPLVLGVCTEPEAAWVRADGKNYADVDAAIVMDHLILQAAALGLGTCWIGAFDAAAARDVLELPPGVEPVAFTPLGHPDDELRPKRRKPLSELVHRDRW